MSEKFCTECGHPLRMKYLKDEGMIPYCDQCEAYRFPMFNTAISAIVYNPAGDKIILIQQYGRKDNILVAGYVTKGEDLQTTVVREIKEELGLDVTDCTFNASEYFAKSNTLMVNFACHVSSEDLTKTNEEIDYVQWYSPEEARREIKPKSLAKKFLVTWLDKQG